MPKHGVRTGPTVISSTCVRMKRYVFTRGIVCYQLSYADDVYILKVYSGDETHSLLSSCFDEVDLI